MAAKAKRPRDQRLDVFRGLTMLIIFIAHVPANPWNAWIPARFGFSSGTELFVFCSGIASAIAFGAVFVKRGLFFGAARIAYRMWQIYWAHICLVLAMVALAAGIDRWTGMSLLVTQFEPLTRDPAMALFGLLTLTWQPDYLDILPMYLVILALLPVMVGVHRLHPYAPFALSVGLYIAVWTTGLNLIGNPWNGAGWFLNPFAWQLVFFTGFAFGMKWLPAPRLGDPWLLALSAIVLVAAVPISFWGIQDIWSTARDIESFIFGENGKSDLHILRFVHFLALAYVVLSLIDPIRDRLDQGAGGVLIRIGQQSLATFLASLVLARIAGAVLDLAGRDALTVAIVNLAGLALVLAVAIVVAWFKSSPWAGGQDVARRPEPGMHSPITRVREAS